MWDKIFLASTVIFFFGIVVFLLGEHLFPAWSSVTLPIGGMVMCIAGLGTAVSGIALILAPNVRT